jgi:hypothetical protein
MEVFHQAISSYYLFEFPLFAINMAAIIPSNNPINIPMVTFFISLPTTIPVIIATINAISLRFSIKLIPGLIECNEIGK